ncbi:filamentous haemagglutinin family protein [Bradyrhizobium campsiandrae]|uniref:Filamentous hemagglutinin family protein n=1 Tax=Bradyrhizobium campsiandrae TaxID=1729892 RepID=A0ABR7UB56_9BRAD|nr:filamentous haemagglutinin family protein [Bradyrhizobium campsiandrae]MBC9980744.1 filamentous hemagglutinin family protein [Bradyrhizobium campsiandrae]
MSSSAMRRYVVRSAWLGGVSLLALLASGKGQARDLNSIGGAVPATAAAIQAAVAAAQQSAAAGAQAQASLARATAALAAARQAQQSAAALGWQARLATGQAIPQGVSAGGLMPSGGVTDTSCGQSCTTFALNTPGAFNGADSKLQQTVDGSGRATVTVTQTQHQAIYNWDSFNISSSTTLQFDQKASDWVALNRVNPDTSPNLLLQSAASNNGHANPSYIGGQIKAPGAVYVINRNGIIFGAGSQINVATFIGSVLDVGKLTKLDADKNTVFNDLDSRDKFFLDTGIANPNPTSFSLYDKDGGANSTLIPGNIVVEQGASITATTATDVVPLGSPGNLYLFGANVYNYGTLTAQQEVGMAASRAVSLTVGKYDAALFPSNVLPNGVTFRGTGLQLQNYGRTFAADGTGNLTDAKYYRDEANHIITGEVTNGGVIDVRQGIAMLGGDRVAVTNLQDFAGNEVRDAAGKAIAGVISADTSISRNSMVLMHAATSVTMDGVISVRGYDDNGSTLPMSTGGDTSSNVQSYMPAYIEMTAQRSVTMGSNSLVSAPSASVSLNAVAISGSAAKRQLFNGNTSGVGTNTATPTLDGAQQVLMSGSDAAGPGAVIDVAGLQDVVLPASYNFIPFQPRAQFADMPLQRNGPLYGQTLYIDIRASGTRSDGTSWVGTPLGDASGEVNAVGRSIQQLMTSGGAVSLTTDVGSSGIVSSGQGVTTSSGSVINVAGGQITFQPGWVPTTRLIGMDGRLYSMENANPNMAYAGIAGQFTVDHSRWGVKEVWSMQTYSPGYTEGHDAGGVSIATVTQQLGGTMYFGSVAGQRQLAQGVPPSDTTDLTSGQAVARQAALQAKGDQLPSQGYLSITTPSYVQIGSSASTNFNVNDPVNQLSADTLSSYGLSALSIKAYDLVLSSGSTVRLAAGGQFTASIAGAIDIAGSISAQGGAINLSTRTYSYKGDFGSNAPDRKAPADPLSGNILAGNVYVEGTLDVSGRFTNDVKRFGLDAQGPAFINGGSISIATSRDSVSVDGSSFRDNTGSILLADKSVLDVSSGGYIGANGQAKLASSGTMAGRGGSISLTLYGTYDFWEADAGGTGANPRLPTADSKQAVLQLGGAMLAYGFESNGSLKLGAADVVRIGGALQAGEKSTIKVGQGATIPAELLNSGGFGSYTFESVSDRYSGAAASITVSAGVALNLTQTNLASSPDYLATGTGTKLGFEARQTPSKLAVLPDDQRKAVNLTLKADNVVLDAGSAIRTDPKATITIGGSRTAADKDPFLHDHPAQSVQLRGSIVDHGGVLAINALNTWLDAWTQSQARIDLSGTFIANSRFGEVGGPALSGTVVSGGTFQVEAASIQSLSVGGTIIYAYGIPAGSVVAESGLQIDVSGYAGQVQVAGARGQTSSTWLWSDAGSVQIDATGLAWGGSFAAAGGRLSDGTVMRAADGKTAIANNGTVVLGGGPMALQQDDAAIKVALEAFHQSSNKAGPGSLYVSADQLAPFDNIYLYSGGAIGGAGRIFTDLPMNTAGLGATALNPLTISNSLSWHVANRLHIAASSIATLQDGSSVTLDAPYVSLTGGTDAVKSGTSLFAVTAEAIDIEGAALSGFGQVRLQSSGDIRLSTPKVANSFDASGNVQGPSSFTGTLAAYGDILLSAQRVYPVSAVDFTIASTAGNVAFRAPEGSTSDLPLSAGGSLTVKASNIDQGGNIFAPLGKIKLVGGTGTNPDGTRQGVVLRPGSLTSVTLLDTVVPYGATSEGTGWYYNAKLKPLSEPPSKGLELDGAIVSVQAGSVIDERGGGDLQAMEWVQGKGGSHDTLTGINGGLANASGAGQTVYALVPSSTSAVAAFDIHITAASSPNAAGQSGKKFTLPGGQVLYLQSGDVYPLAGTQISVNGGNGIPAGTYTLFPAHYATLPGAMRVVYYGDNTSGTVTSGTTLQDGTVLVTGNYTQSTVAGKQSSGQSIFAVQSNAVWQQYSEYSFNRANVYFAQKAVHDGANVPRLPMDGGRLAVNALQDILLEGVAKSRPAPGGRGGELDIAGTKLAIVGRQQYLDRSNPDNVAAGYIAIDADQLNSFGFESVLIGGTRGATDPTKGTLITPVATDVMVDTRGDKVAVPELMLVTQAAGQWHVQDQWYQVGSTLVYVPVALYGPSSDVSVVIKSGSIIETTGNIDAGYGRQYSIVNSSPPQTALSRAQEVAQSLGGTLQADGTITGVDLSKLKAFWYWNDFKSWTSTPGVDPTSLAFYAFGGPTSQQPGLGALFVASGDAGLKVNGPTGVPVPPLTLKFADLKSVPGVPDTGPVTTLDGKQASLTLPGGDAGRITIEAGATVTTTALTLQATAATNAIALNGDVHATKMDLRAQSFAIGSGSGAAPASVRLSADRLGGVEGLTLRTLSGAVSVYGSFDPAASMTSLTLDTAAITRGAGSGDGNIRIRGLADDGKTEVGSITLLNSTGLSLPTGLAAASSGSLAFDSVDIVFGGGAQTIAGASGVALKASDQVLLAASGKLTLGVGTDANPDKVNLGIVTPNVLVASATGSGSGSFTLTTQGDVSFADVVARTGLASRPTDSSQIGGNLAVIASNITVGTTIQAQAGTVTLEATGPSLSLTDGAYIAAGGYAKVLGDTTTYAAGGKVVLFADAAGGGTVATSEKSVIDVAQPVGGIGYGGQIQVSTTAGRAILLGQVLGRGGNGLGGGFKVDANSLQLAGTFDPNVRLDPLADRLLAGGLDGAIDIHTRTGNLVLSNGHVLKAHTVVLTADDTNWDNANPAAQFGQITLAGKIDARGYDGVTADGTGQAGGQVSLYGANQVTLAGTSLIDASTSHADERGGDVTVGIPWAAKGKIRLQSGMTIDVSGGTKGGLSGGTVTFRAPVDGNGGAKIVGIDANGSELSAISPNNVHITGARTVAIEGFLAIDTKASNYGVDGSKLGWDGLIDPANAYDANGNLVTTGNWTGVTGFQFTVTNGGSGYKAPPLVNINSFGDLSSAIAVMGLDGVTPLTLSAGGTPLTLTPNLSNLKVTFDTPTNGGSNVTRLGAQGIATTDASGALTIQITNAGSGYTNLTIQAHVFAADGTKLADAVVTAGGLKVVGIAANSSKTFANISSVAFLNTGAPPSSAAAVAVAKTSSLTGKTNTAGAFVLTQTNAFASTKALDTAVFAPEGAHGQINDAIKVFSQGGSTLNGQDYGFSKLIAMVTPLAQGLGAGVVHVRPGVELVNSDSSINSGNITVKGNWNLAAGTAYNLQPNGGNGSKYVHVEDTADVTQQSYVTFDYRMAANYGTGTTSIEAGALTLRATNSVIIGGSISDGFFQFANYLDTNYSAALASYINNNTLRGIDPDTTGSHYQYYLNANVAAPIAPYRSSANISSPTSADLAAADLFPNQLNVCVANCGTANATIVTVTDPASWSYRITAGANLASGNPNAVRSLETTIYNPKYVTAYDNTSRTPSVIMTGQTSYNQTVYNGAGATSTKSVTLPTMVRTGTGSVSVSAAYDVFLSDPNTTSPTANKDAPGVIYAAGVNTAKLPDPQYNGTAIGNISADPSQLFLEPRLLMYGSDGAVYGPPTAAAFPHMGGDVAVTAQNDIVGYSAVTDPSTGGLAAKTSYQFYKQWLLADAGLTPADIAAAASVSLRGQGVFAPGVSAIASQTAWWIEYSSFQQGILSAGGNATVVAGRDINDVSVSLPTTGRVSGGLSASNTPVTHVYDSGNMVVSAGRDVLGGSFYEGAGHGAVVAGRSIGATSEKLAWAGIDRNKAAVLVDNLPVLAVDLGMIQVRAGAGISVDGPINPAASHQQASSAANPAGNTTAVYMDTYGPQSGATLLSTAGNVTIGIAPTGINSSTSTVFPASFEAIALGGDIVTTGLSLPNTASISPQPGMVLSGSENGEFQLLASGSIDLTFGYDPAKQLRPYISAGPALLDKAFDPFRPNAWYGTHIGDPSYGGGSSSVVLAHQNDDNIARIVAQTGNIVAGGRTVVNDNNVVTALVRVEINRPAAIYAGGDITDLNVIVQNINSSDVSSIVAGGNISYTGLNAAGGIQVAGPGFLVVQAGGDLGPFVPAAHNTTTEIQAQQGIASVGNSSTSPVGNAFVMPTSNGGPTGMYNSALLGPYNSPSARRNDLLSSKGADIVAMFGVSKGINYDGVFKTYVDPASNANVAHNYVDELRAFLTRIGKPADSDPIAAFKALPDQLQHVFLDQVFFAELKAVAQSTQGKDALPRGYQAVETMFPASFGYSSSDGSSIVKTGDLNLLHSTIQTKLGGDISIFGPGGNIVVGSLASETNAKLKLSDIGILTLGGGAINTFTDQSVRVNSSRVLTTQGGDILMWSSNGDLDAGRGSKTTLSLPPLQVLFDRNDYQSVDLGGFVTGAGIATLKASRLAKSSNTYLLAPRGTIDFGTAGVRSSGNLVVVAPVVANASNNSVQGTTTGIPTISVQSVGSATSGNSATKSTQTSDTPTASGNSNPASVFIVEVVGYGGGDGSGAAAGGAASSQNTTPAAQGSSEDKKDKDGQQ